MEDKYSTEKIMRYIFNESSEEEKKELDIAIDVDEDLKKMVAEMRLVVSVKQKPFKITSADKKWKSVKSKLNEIPVTKEYDFDYLSGRKLSQANRKRNRVMRVWQYAAVILFMISISVFLLQKLTPWGLDDPEYSTLIVKNSERKMFVLYDGTTVSLDSGSELKYPKKFGKERIVYLKGEGFFQVAKDANRPFYVYADNALIKVVGTKFDIRSWDGDNKGVMVTVKEGVVIVSNSKKTEGEKVYLYKNMQSRVSPEGVVSKPVMVDASNYLRWMNNEIHFQNASLKEILSQLERWYDLKFVVDDELIEKKNLTVHLTGTNLNELLELISKMTNTRIERHGKIIEFVK
jgi:ferric-dicitrate binding protein FerR (iron transport regulator)